MGMRVGMGEKVRLIRDDGRQCGVDVVDGQAQPVQLGRIEPPEDLAHQVVTHDLHVGQNLPSSLAHPNQHDSAIIRIAKSFDEPALLHSVDQAGGIRVRDIEQLGDATHRQLAMAIQHRHEVEMAHRDAVPDQPLAGHAAELAERGAKLAHDGIDEGRRPFAR